MFLFLQRGLSSDMLFCIKDFLYWFVVLIHRACSRLNMSDKNSISILVMSNVLVVWWGVNTFVNQILQIQIDNDSVKRRMGSWVFNHIWFGSKNQIYTWRRVFCDNCSFLNLQMSEMRCNGFNFTAFMSCFYLKDTNFWILHLGLWWQ